MAQKENIKFIYTLNNKSRSANFFLLFILSGVVFLGGAFYFLFMNNTPFLIATVVLAILWFFVLGKSRPSYFEMLLTEQQMQINHYSVATAARNYHSVEIWLKDFVDFGIRKSFFGLRKELILSVNMRLGVADYPPISITILTKSELAQVLAILQKIKSHQL